jgi:hypothetical protein
MPEGSRQPIARSWLVHDLIVGIAGGLVIGFIAGLLTAAAVSGSGPLPDLLVVAGPLAGATTAVTLLIRSHQDRGRFLTPAVVVVWALTLLAVAFFIALLSAISNFT